MTVDEKRGLVFVPDRLRGLRLLRREPPRRQPLRQLVCSPSTPTPASASGTSRPCSTTSGTATSRRRRRSSPSRRDGKPVDAVAQITKSGYVFVFDRETGKPLFPIEERECPRRDVDGEVAAPKRSRCPLKPAPFARQRLHRGHADEAHAGSARGGARALPNSAATGQFMPPSSKAPIIFPGFDGGGEWGGPAFDPRDRPALRQRQRDGLDPAPRAERERTAAASGPDALPAQLRHLPPRRSERHARRSSRRCIDIANAVHRREIVSDMIRNGAGRMPGFAHLREPAIRRHRRLHPITGEDETVAMAARTRLADRH